MSGGDGGGEKALAPEVAPALCRIDALLVVLGGARRDPLARDARRARDDLVGSVGIVTPQLMDERAAVADRRDVTQRQVSTWCSSIMLPAGSCMKSCCDWGPTTPSVSQ